MRRGKIVGKVFGIAAAFVMVVGLGSLATPAGLVLADDPVVTFNDPNIEWAIRQVLEKPTGVIRQSDLERLTRLGSERQGISDLSGLEYCVNLTILYLHDNQISDISALRSLANLGVLYLNNNQISDISPLSYLANLTELHLYDNRISDISALSSLANLTRLHLDSNQIMDISPLSSLANLTTLALGYNQISDISPLSSLPSLTNLYLYLHNNQISDISSLVDNIELGEGNYVDLRYNHLDLTPGSKAVNDIQTLRDRGVGVDYEPQRAVVTPPDLNDVQVGIKAGDWIKIEYKIDGWPAEQPRPMWLRCEFLSVEGTHATALVTMGMSDGTQQTNTVSGDIREGGGGAFGLSGFVIPANLTTGDTVYMTGYGNLPIEGEAIRTYGGARRSAVYASFSQHGSSLTYYWDQQTGVVVEASTTYTGTTATAKATETNMWEADSIWMRWWLWIIVAVVVVALAGAVYSKKRNMRSGVSP